MLGGIFPTIGAGAHAAGPGVILAYVLSVVVSLCVAFCYAEFASMVPVAGSAYTYAYATLAAQTHNATYWLDAYAYGYAAQVYAAQDYVTSGNAYAYYAYLYDAYGSAYSHYNYALEAA